MVDKFLKYFAFSDQICVVGIFEFGGHKIYRSLLARKSNKEIHITGHQDFESVSHLLDGGIPKDHSILLHLEGDTIINRELENSSQYRSSIIYDADEKNFFFSEYHQESKIFISLTRKKEIDAWVEQLKKHGAIVSGVSVGPFVVSSLFRLMPEQKVYKTPSGELNLYENNLSFKPGPTDENFFLEFNSEMYGIYELILIGVLIDYFYPGKLEHSHFEGIDSSGQEIKYKRAFKMVGLAVLPLFMILIIFGHFYLNSLREELSENEARHANIQESLDQITQLKKERDIKRRILQTSGVFINDYLTGRVLDISNSLPKDIKLTNLAVFPALDRIKSDKKVIFDFKLIEIQGLSNSERNVNGWLQDIQDYSWVHKVEIISFEREAVGKFIFHFKILL